MRNLVALILLVIGMWYPPAWLIAYFVGRTCHRCKLREQCDKHRSGAEILHHPGSRGYK